MKNYRFRILLMIAVLALNPYEDSKVYDAVLTLEAAYYEYSLTHTGQNR